MEQREVAKIEHTMNILAGIAVLKTMYGMHIDESDYLDIAVGLLKDIKSFGVTEYVMYAKVRQDGKVVLPCNVDTIDAVTTEHMAKKVFNSRVLYDTMLSDSEDDFYVRDNIRNTLGLSWGPGLGGFRGEGYISYQLKGRYLEVSKDISGDSIGIAFTGISSDLDGFPLITRKQSNAIAAECAKILCMRGANSGNKNLASMLEYHTLNAGRLIQAASIPEEISDNAINEMLNAKTTFNRKTYNRPSKFGR
jgi:hypothetical protein